MSLKLLKPELSGYFNFKDLIKSIYVTNVSILIKLLLAIAKLKMWQVVSMEDNNFLTTIQRLSVQ